MRVTISHNKSVEEIRANIDRSFDDIFKGLPVGPIQISNQQRTWAGNTMTFSFDAKAAFLNVPIKGWVLLEPTLITVDVDLPGFIKNFLPEQKLRTAVESGVKGLLT